MTKEEPRPTSRVCAGQTGFPLVVLSGQLSNPPRPLLRMLRGETARVITHPRQAASAPERQRRVHLPAQSQRDLIERHKAGATQRELAGGSSPG